MSPKKRSGGVAWIESLASVCAASFVFAVFFVGMAMWGDSGFMTVATIPVIVWTVGVCLYFWQCHAFPGAGRALAQFHACAMLFCAAITLMCFPTEYAPAHPDVVLLLNGFASLVMLLAGSWLYARSREALRSTQSRWDRRRVRADGTEERRAE
jgi:peptidoglycan/LPS O-acetylase OafA/YrhL